MAEVPSSQHESAATAQNLTMLGDRHRYRLYRHAGTMSIDQAGILFMLRYKLVEMDLLPRTLGQKTIYQED
jgi:hypothetical protein